MWMYEDGLAGRIAAGKSHHGATNENISLILSGKRVYQLQKFLEEEVGKGGDYFRVRWLVLMAEEIRLAVYEASENGLSESCEGVAPHVRKEARSVS